MKRLRRRYGRPLGPRPKNPAEISFDPRCFVQDGTDVEFTVGRSSLHSGPARFTNEKDAAAYAEKTGRTYTRHEVPRMRRVAWKAP